MGKRIVQVFGLLLCALIAARAEQVEMLSKPHRIEHVIKSMEGDVDNVPFQLLPNQPPELVWVTAGRVKVIDADTSADEPIEMLCHSHMEFPFNTYNAFQRNALFNQTTHMDVKVFTLVQGQTDIQLPKGFGVPVLSNEQFEFSSMIISPQQPPKPLSARAKGTFEFTRDRELKTPIKALYWRGLSVMVPVKEGNSHDSEKCSSELRGSSPQHSSIKTVELDAKPAPISMSLVHQDASGQFRESYHWLVPPGRHEYRYTLEYDLPYPFDTTTLHYANLHLHPYAESLELRDLTTGQSIFKGYAESFKGNTGIAKLTHFSSEQGVPVFKDHRYELVAVYNNTTDKDIDAMAIMFVYLWDKSFDRSQIKIASADPSASK